MDLIQIRAFRHSTDHDALVRLVVDIQRDEYGLYQALEDQPDLMDVEAYYMAAGGHFWVAYAGTDLVGCVGLLRLADGSSSELKKMYVAQPYRGAERAIAQQMMDGLARWANQAGIRAIYLDTLATMHAAIRFYERNGFEPVRIEDLPDVYYHPIGVEGYDLRYFVRRLG
jgi:GNAT superfamily N-acetyltransferase